MEANKSIDWNVNAEEVYEALNDVCRKMSDTLKTKKFYFLNDFYESIGLPRDTNRERAGWCYNDKTGEYELVDDIYNNIHDYNVLIEWEEK